MTNFGLLGALGEQFGDSSWSAKACLSNGPVNPAPEKSVLTHDLVSLGLGCVDGSYVGLSEFHSIVGMPNVPPPASVCRRRAWRLRLQSRRGWTECGPKLGTAEVARRRRRCAMGNIRHRRATR